MKGMKILLGVCQIATVCYLLVVMYRQHNIDREPTKDSAFKAEGYAAVELMSRKQTPRSDFEILRAPWKVTCRDQMNTKPASWSMIICVKSGVKNSERRTFIRQTWGSKQYYQNVRLAIIFVVGQDHTSSVADIENEEMKYGDILQVNVSESYNAVGYKVLAGMQWIWQNCQEHWIYASSDDDMVPHLNKVYSIVERDSDLDSESGTVICHFSLRVGRVPIRESNRKNHVSTDIYSHAKYPSFCAGGFYSMPVSIANAIFRESRYHHYFFNDDVWITGLLRLSAINAGLMPCRNISDETCGLSKFLGGSVKHGIGDKLTLTLLHKKYPLAFNSSSD